MTQKSVSFNDVVIITVRRNYYMIHFWGMSKNEAMNRIKNAVLSDICGQLCR